MVGLASAGPNIGPVEAAIEDLLYQCSARKEFVILHTEQQRNEDGQWKRVPTRQWMLPRFWTNGHHHLRLSDVIRELPGETATASGLDPASRSMLWRSDFGRIARRIAGTSIGLVRPFSASVVGYCHAQ